MLQEYFDSKLWYSPLYTPDEFSQIESSTFNEYEKENIKFLSELISKKNICCIGIFVYVLGL